MFKHCKIKKLITQFSFSSGPHNENARPSQHRKIIPGYRNRKDVVPRNGIREWWRSLRLLSITRSDERKRSPCQIQANCFRRAILPSKEDYTQVCTSYHQLLLLSVKVKIALFQIIYFHSLSATVNLFLLL